MTPTRKKKAKPVDDDLVVIRGQLNESLEDLRVAGLVIAAHHVSEAIEDIDDQLGRMGGE